MKMSAKIATTPWHQKEIEAMKNSPQLLAEFEKLKRLPAGAKCLKVTTRKKRSHLSKRFPPNRSLCDGRPIYYLFEFASGYALFYAHGVDCLVISYESQLKYITNFEIHDNSDIIFTLKAYHPFSSTTDALVQMNAISNGRVTPQLKSFLLDNLPKGVDGKLSCLVATSQTWLAHNIAITTGIHVVCGILCFDITRYLRMKIDKFIDGLEPKDLRKQQLNLARLYSKQRCSTTVVKCSHALSSSSLQQLYVVPHRGRQRSTTMVVKSSKAIASSSLQQFVIVPHRFEGVFIAKGKEEFICTRNLVQGQAIHGEELIYIQNEDGTEVEYRVWNPLRSKLAAAILCGIENFCVKPGSRVLYLGDVCEITVSHLSDLVGSDGLVYVVGFSDVIVNMVEKRPNVITILEKPLLFWKYRMVVSMVDVIVADNIYPRPVYWIVNNAKFYLRAGGHYMISTQANNFDLNGQGKELFANHHRWREFNPIELVMLEPIVRENVMAVGSFRVLEE